MCLGIGAQLPPNPTQRNEMSQRGFHIGCTMRNASLRQPPGGNSLKSILGVGMRHEILEDLILYSRYAIG